MHGFCFAWHPGVNRTLALLNRPIIAGPTETVAKTFFTALSYLPDQHHHHQLSSSEASSGSVITGGWTWGCLSPSAHLRLQFRVTTTLLCFTLQTTTNILLTGTRRWHQNTNQVLKFGFIHGGILWVSGICSLPWCLLYSPICFFLFVCLSLCFGAALLSSHLPNCCSADTPVPSLPILHQLIKPSIHQTWFLRHTLLDCPVCQHSTNTFQPTRLNLNFYEPMTECFFWVLN